MTEFSIYQDVGSYFAHTLVVPYLYSIHLRVSIFSVYYLHVVDEASQPCET